MTSHARVLVAVAATLLLVAHAANAQRLSERGPMPPYDPATVTTLHGTVSAVERVTPLAPMMARLGQGVHLRLDRSDGPIEVHLGPASYVEQQRVQIHVGDVVDVTGSRVTIAGKPALLAAVVRRGADLLTLRDSDGRPRWAGPRRGMRR